MSFVNNERTNDESFISRASFSHSGSMASRSSMSLNQQSQLRQKESRILSTLDRVRQKLKVLSLYFVVFSVFILLNACIGFSSAPFYSPDTDCDLYHPSSECQTLEINTNILYAFELVFSIVLMVNGCLAVTLSDNLRLIWLRKVNIVYAKCGLIAYPVLFLVRTILYTDVVNRLKPDMDTDFLSLYSNLFAVYVRNEMTQFIVTSVVLTCYFLCYGFTVFIVRYCN